MRKSLASARDIQHVTGQVDVDDPHRERQRLAALQLAPALAGCLHDLERAHHAADIARVDRPRGGWIARSQFGKAQRVLAAPQTGGATTRALVRHGCTDVDLRCTIAGPARNWHVAARVDVGDGRAGQHDVFGQ